MKILIFEREQDSIHVEYKSTLVDKNDDNENFRVSYPKGIDSFLTTQLFYWFDKKKWTLNEMKFFAKNNNLTLKIN